jgi:PAS domain-containing protein
MKDENKIKAELIKELKTLREERRESVINDITKRKQAEESLRESEAKYRAVNKVLIIYSWQI